MILSNFYQIKVIQKVVIVHVFFFRFHVFGDRYFYNRVGVAIFVLTAHGKYMIGGVGWDNNVHAHLRNYVMLRWWNVLARWQLYVVTAHGKYMIGGVGGGVGWDNNVHARLRNYVMLRWWNVLARWQLYVVTAHGKYMIGGGGGVGWGGIITSMHACGTMWCYVDGMCLHAGSSTWSPHMESIWLGGVGGWGGIITSMHACGTMWCYKLIVVGTISKKLPQSNEEPHWPNNQCEVLG